MTRLILDYYRRWGRVLAIGAVPLLVLGWWIAVEPKTPIEFIVALLPVWILHMFDLSRGAIRVLHTLPLTPRQIGRSWWLVNVFIPAVIVAALLFLGAGSAVLCHSGHAFPLHRLALASLFALLWLGTVFVPFVPLAPASRNFSNWWWHLFSTIFIVLVTVVLTFWMVIRAVSSFTGFLLSQDAAKSPVMLAILLAGGAFLTCVGWFRAGRFDPAGAQFGRPNTGLSAKFYAYKAGAASVRPTPPSTAPHQPPKGHGGILFLLRTTFIRGLLGSFVGVIFALILAWPFSQFPGWQSKDSMITLFLIFILFPLRHSLMQLRFLRTLPISTAKLASLIIASVIVPIVAVTVLMVGIAGLSTGNPVALTILKSCLLALSPIALCAFFPVWRGDGIQAYALCVVAMMAWILAASALQNITFPLAGGVAVAGVMLAWVLTYYALLRGSRAYRIQTNPLGNFLWNARQ
jgi:hypothetical protein